MSVEPSEILFLGIGDTAVLWYRCALPAEALGADWAGVSGNPPSLHMVTGMVRDATQLPNYKDYAVIVVQQPLGRDWMRLIKRLQGEGRRVLFEVDDYLHGVAKVKGHHFAKSYSKAVLKEFELCMRICDGIIVSTPYLHRRYRSFNKHVYLCENGLDCERYRLTRPERSTVNIGWAGATGHTQTVIDWLNGAVTPTMRRHDDVNFVSIGNLAYSQAIQRLMGEERAIGTPFNQFIESYPASMMMIDIAIGPAGQSAWYKGKSDLRWLEAGALGIPIVADPACYPEIEHGVTGFHAKSPSEAGEIIEHLVTDQEERRRVGEAARSYVREHRDIRAMAPRWLEVAQEAASIRPRS